jgi:hypothetical protein
MTVEQKTDAQFGYAPARAVDIAYEAPSANHDPACAGVRSAFAAPSHGGHCRAFVSRQHDVGRWHEPSYHLHLTGTGH